MSSVISRALAKIVSPTRTWKSYATLFLQSHYTTTTSTATSKSKSKSKPESEVEVVNWEKPSEIPFQAKIANSVNVMGYVHIPVQFKSSPDGKCWAGTVITQAHPHSHSHSLPLWIPIIFEGDLAHIAACHLKQNNYVHVAGRLSADPPHLNANLDQANIQVMVQSLNFVQGSSEMKNSSTFHEQKLSLQRLASVKDEDDINQSWKNLLANPHEWWDIRLKEDNPKGAAFEQKNDGKLLWIDDSTPKSVQKKLDSIKFECKTQLKSSRTEEKTAGEKRSGDYKFNSWRELLDDPKQWWDYRDSKLSGSVNPKHPDFKHKVGGYSLWLTDAPGWILSELEGVEFDFQTPKSKLVKQHKGDESWKDLVQNPDNWWDNRLDKRNVRAPDFKHKETGEGLWLSGSPAWVLPKLPALKGNKI